MDFNFKKARLSNSPKYLFVHEGFLDIYQSLISKINRYLMNMLYSRDCEGYKPALTGKSLEGALATIQIVDIALKAKNKGFEI
jgi:hypothetical protein